LWVIFASWIRIRIRIPNPDPYPDSESGSGSTDPSESGSGYGTGSATLVKINIYWNEKIAKYFYLRSASLKVKWRIFNDFLGTTER
jgi:hypothetical protein